MRKNQKPDAGPFKSRRKGFSRAVSPADPLFREAGRPSGRDGEKRVNFFYKNLVRWFTGSPGTLLRSLKAFHFKGFAFSGEREKLRTLVHRFAGERIRTIKERKKRNELFNDV